MEDPGFQEFFEGNREWLLPYAAFCVLRDKYDTADFSRWEKYSIYDRKKVDTLWKNVRSGREMRYYVYLQHHLHLQMPVSYTHLDVYKRQVLCSPSQ